MSINPSSSNHNSFLVIPSAAMFCGLTFNLNTEGDERERMTTSAQEKLFEKPLTPSDVGKLNRLVIPKQHAEKHFPLNGGGESGLLLGFEDEAGKPWRFRYSYWNSSQSYVLTKGWSRFVKEKRLDAGDVVLFGRHRSDFGRLFIGWRRRNAQPQLGWNAVVYPPDQYSAYNQRSTNLQDGSSSSSVVYQSDCANADENERSGSGNSKRLRLFGVNLEAADSSDHQRTWI